LVEALDLAVGARPVGLGGEMADAAGEEQFAQRAVLDVAVCVVGHQSPCGDAVGGEERQGAFDKAGNGRGLLVVVELDVGQAGVVVDDRVRVVVADAGAGGHPVAIALGAIAGGAVPRAPEARVAADIHVQQIARAWPLVAIRLASLSRRTARKSVTLEHLPDGLMRLTGRSGDQPRPPTGGLPDRADPRREILRHPPRLVMRAAGAISQPRTAVACGRVGLKPAMPPPMCRGHRNRTLFRGSS
jgi:hypothetical protein